MDDQVNRLAPEDVTAALDDSARHLASGAMSDARSVQIEAWRILSDYDCVHSRLAGRRRPQFHVAVPDSMIPLAQSDPRRCPGAISWHGLALPEGRAAPASEAGRRQEAH